VPIHAIWGCSGSKNGGNENVLQFYPSMNAIIWDWHPMNEIALKLVLRLSLGMRAKFRYKRKKLKSTKESARPGRPVICRVAHISVIDMNCGLRGHSVDVITRAKFCDTRFKGFRLSEF